MSSGSRREVQSFADRESRASAATIGPDFVAIRAVSGISDVKSGLDYYVIKAPSG